MSLCVWVGGGDWETEAHPPAQGQHVHAAPFGKF